MKKTILVLSLFTFTLVFQSCGGPASEAKKVCECYEEAKEEDDREKSIEMNKECDAMAKEVDEKYKDDKEAREKMGEACDVW